MDIEYNTPKETVSGYAVLGGKIDQKHYVGTFAAIVGESVPIEVRLFKIGSKFHACAFFHDSKRGVHSYGYGRDDYSGRACFNALQGLGFNFPRLTICMDLGTFEGLFEEACATVYKKAFIKYFTF